MAVVNQGTMASYVRTTYVYAYDCRSVGEHMGATRCGRRRRSTSGVLQEGLDV
jgi:hypothetical protein